MKNSIVYLGLVILSSAILLMYSCSKSSSSSYTNPGGGGGSNTSVKIQGSAFVPDTINITAGTTVTWTNMDALPHTVTDAGIFDSGSIAMNGTYQYTFPVAGTYIYNSTVNAAAKSGVVIVTASMTGGGGGGY